MKKVKNFTKVPVLFILLAAAVFSCKKDSDKDPAPGSKGVEGSWKMTAMLISPAYEGITDMLKFYSDYLGNDCLYRVTIIMKPDGTVGGTVPSDCSDEGTDIFGEPSKWKVVGNKIQLIDGSTVDEYDLEVNGSEMKWSYEEIIDGDTHKATIVLKKV